MPGASLYQVTNLGTLLGGVYADGRGISSNGLVTGFASIASGPGGNRPFLYQDGVLTNLDPLGQSIDSRGFAINSSGQVTGFFQVPGSSPAHAFLYSDGVITDIAAGDSRNSIGQGINDRSQIVG
ncbi:MAG: HAF repeat-containing protein, partial [Bryobacteraceae bacterium]